MHSLNLSDLTFLNWSSESLLISSCIVPVAWDRYPRWHHSDESTEDSVRSYVNDSYLDTKLPISKVEKGSNVRLCKDTERDSLAWILSKHCNWLTWPCPVTGWYLNVQICKIRGGGWRWVFKAPLAPVSPGLSLSCILGDDFLWV